MNVKECTQCRIEKEVIHFQITSRGKFGRHSLCRECQKHNAMIYYYKNKEKISQRKKIEYIEKNREVQLSKYHRNKENIQAASKARYQTVRGRAKNIWRAARDRSKAQGLDFSVDFARIEFALLMKKCERSGIEFDLSAIDGSSRNPFAPSIDKIDRTLGYTNENIQIVVWCYNTGKGEMTDEQFIEFCRIVAERYPR